MSGRIIITKKSIFNSILEIIWKGIKKGATISRYAIGIIDAIVVVGLIGGIVGGPRYLDYKTTMAEEERLNGEEKKAYHSAT